MKTISLQEFRDTLKIQGVKPVDYAFVCPRCRTVQSAQDLIKAGAGENFEQVEKYLGFSCFGRFTNAGAPTKGQKGPCNWTLGGLFQIHNLEIVDEDGKHHPIFEPASPELAQQHALKHASEIRHE
ncbi:hypothetical protein GOC95_05520 [Methylophilus sp. YYY-1]|nr:hypothetical protein [Methylophilus sp. YYY-1]